VLLDLKRKYLIYDYNARFVYYIEIVSIRTPDFILCVHQFLHCRCGRCMVTD